MRFLHMAAAWALLIPLCGLAEERSEQSPQPPERFQLPEHETDPVAGADEEQYRIESTDFFGYWSEPRRRTRTLYFWESTLDRRAVSTSYLAPAPDPGEILPMFGRLYRATAPCERPNFLTFTFVRLGANDIPTGVTVERTGTYIVPLQKHGYGATTVHLLRGNDGWVRFQCKSIEPNPDDTQESVAELEASVFHLAPPGSKRKFSPKSKKMQFSIRQGKTYSLETPAPRRFTVQRIVPRNKQWKTLGWVELKLSWRD
jgi:hypothetical protein